jgi:hypothetical protein
MTAPDAAAERAERRPAVVLSTLLLLAGILAGLSPIVGIVRTADGSPTTASVPAAFVVVLPGVLRCVDRRGDLPPRLVAASSDWRGCSPTWPC